MYSISRVSVAGTLVNEITHGRSLSRCVEMDTDGNRRAHQKDVYLAVNGEKTDEMSKAEILEKKSAVS